MERRAGDAAVIDVHDACTGRVGELRRVVVPCLPRREVGVYEHAQLARPDGLIGSPSRDDRDERFGPEQTEVQPIIARTGPRNRRVDSAVEDTSDLNVTGHDPLVDANVQRRGSRQIVGKPTDVTDPQRSRRSREPALCARRELEDLACVGQQHPAGRRQLDMPAVADEQRRADARLERLDLLRKRRRRDVQAFRRTAEVKLLGDRDEVAQQPQLHAPNTTPPVLARA
jgi:hypothetical protein